MGISSKPQFLLLLPAILVAAQPQPFPNCTTTCGSLEIPFPFGTTEGCYLDPSFLITCNQTNSGTSSSSYTPFMRRSNTTVLNISLDGEMHVGIGAAYGCYNDNGTLLSQQILSLNLSYFYFSHSRNKFTAIGCDSLGLIEGRGSFRRNYTTGCLSLCDRLEDVEEATGASCSGSGCCEAPIPEGLSTVSFGSFTAGNNNTHGFNPCGYAFLVEEGRYNFNSSDLKNLSETMFPMVLDWAVGNQTCEEAQKNLTSYSCVAENSYCYNSTNGFGYRCNCSHGFQGNPYLLSGCREINQCLQPNDCIKDAKCQNFLGGYNCWCPEGQEGDGKSQGSGCHPKSNSNSRTIFILIIALSVSVGVLLLLMGSFYVYWGMKKRKLLKLKQNFFLQNGGILLQQRIASQRGSENSIETAKVFTEEELKKATNNFDETRVLGQGGYGTVYKGLLPSNRVVAIKKSKISDPGQIEQFINEVVVLSQINHRNVVKILGCCLETEIPLLVYEFISNGTLSMHLHNQGQSLKLSWKTRLRIATETASALSYLHSATSTTIIHRDVKTTNILLDSDLTAKVSDFGASRLVPLDQTQITTLVQGTFGYLDPEYFHTSQLTDKSDVYSFGVVLAELLTGLKALSFERPENDINLSVYFVTSMKEGRLLDIVDTHIKNEVHVEHLTEVANIAKQCLHVTREDRPTMKEVAMELEGLRVLEKNRWESVNRNSDEMQYLLNQDLYHYDVGIGESSTTSYGLDSLHQMSATLGGGR